MPLTVYTSTFTTHHMPRGNYCSHLCLILLNNHFRFIIDLPSAIPIVLLQIHQRHSKKSQINSSGILPIHISVLADYGKSANLTILLCIYELKRVDK